MIAMRPTVRLSCVVLLGFASIGHAQETRVAGGKPASEVRDAAELFSPRSVGEARKVLEALEKETDFATLIETVESVEKGSVKEVTNRNAANWGKRGLYVLIDRKEHKFEMTLTREVPRNVSLAGLTTIRNAFLESFKNREYDGGLGKGVAAIEKVVRDAPDAYPAKVVRGNPEGARPTNAGRMDDGAGWEKGAEAYVERGQVRLRLDGARIILAGAEKKAAEMKIRANIAVVDDGGNLLLFVRMDGARLASGATAITKATSAATFLQETGAMGKEGAAPDLLLSLSLQNAAAASGGKVTSLPGGIPIRYEGQVIGGVGIAGGTGEQDAEIARAALARFREALPGAGEDRKATTESPARSPY